jgi:hypothetical protein
MTKVGEKVGEKRFQTHGEKACQKRTYKMHGVLT